MKKYKKKSNINKKKNEVILIKRWKKKNNT